MCSYFLLGLAGVRFSGVTGVVLLGLAGVILPGLAGVVEEPLGFSGVETPGGLVGVEGLT